MAGLTKKDIKEVVIESLAPFAKAVQKDFEKVNERFDKVDGRLDKVEGRLDKLGFDVHELKKDVKEMKDKSSELFKKLDDMITMYKKHEQEIAIMNIHIKRLEERISKLEEQRK